MAAFLLGSAVATPALACEVPNPLRPELVVFTPVVVRGEVTGIEILDDDSAVLTLDVTETYKGTAAETWTVTWSWESVIVPPQTLEAFAETYGGLDVVLGLTPDVPEIASDNLPATLDDGAGWLAQENCAVPFLGGYAEMEAMLREHELIE
jgi:hypothetical protein